MSFGPNNKDQTPHRILTAMIAAGAVMTMVSFAMKLGPGPVKTGLEGAVSRAGLAVTSLQVVR